MATVQAQVLNTKVYKANGVSLDSGRYASILIVEEMDDGSGNAYVLSGKNEVADTMKELDEETIGKIHKKARSLRGLYQFKSGTRQVYLDETTIQILSN